MAMGLLTSVSIHIFPVLMLLVIYLNNHRKTSETADKRLFDLLTLLALGALLAETFGRGLEGKNGDMAQSAVWMFGIIYAWTVAGTAGTWFLYVAFRLKYRARVGRAKQLTRLFSIAQLLLAGVLVTIPWTHLIFFIGREHQCVPGKLFWLLYLESAAWLLAGAVIAFRRIGSGDAREQRRECIDLTVCSLILLVGMTVQYCRQEWWGSTACLSLTILFIYLDTQNRQITTDSLTGLNNRREFDKQIERWAEQHGRNWGMLMLDIDDFKSINDHMGHIAGDEALWETADLLRRVLGKEKTFLARYGGDEFAVIGAWEDAQAAGAAIAAIEQEVRIFNATAKKGYRLSFSVGYAMWDEARETQSLIKIADERMYQIKAQKKSAAEERN